MSVLYLRRADNKILWMFDGEKREDTTRWIGKQKIAWSKLACYLILLKCFSSKPRLSQPITLPSWLTCGIWALPFLFLPFLCVEIYIFKTYSIFRLMRAKDTPRKVLVHYLGLCLSFAVFNENIYSLVCSFSWWVPTRSTLFNTRLFFIVCLIFFLVLMFILFR